MNHPKTQESKTERCTIPCTPTEKDAIQMVAKARSTRTRRITEADLLREMLMADIVDEYWRIMARLRQEDVA